MSDSQEQSPENFIHPVDRWAKWLPLGFQEFFRNKYDSSTDKERQNFFKYTFILFLLVAIIGVVYVTSDEENEYVSRMNQSNEKPVTKTMISSERIDALADEALAKQISDMEKSMNALVRSQNRQEQEHQKEVEGMKSRELRLSAELKAVKEAQSEEAYQQNLERLQQEMKQKLAQIEKKQELDSNELKSRMQEKMGNIFYAPNVSQPQQPESTEEGQFVLHKYGSTEEASGGESESGVVDKAKEMVGSTGDEEEKEKVEEPNETYLPTTSLINGVLLSGLDAKASIIGTDDNPQPVLIQVKGNAYLPNGYEMDLDSCQLLATGWGDINSERVHLRTNKLICINEEGGVVDIPIDAVATSAYDGKEGIRGRLVSREGKMITKAMIAGFLNGVSSAFKPASALGATTGGSPFETANLSQAGNIGLSSGVGGAMDKLAEYYVSMIGKMSPILEIAPRQEIQFITVEGVLLKWS
jgi:conjugal transfer pilus assembly protein TraB